MSYKYDRDLEMGLRGKYLLQPAENKFEITSSLNSIDVRNVVDIKITFLARRHVKGFHQPF